MKQLNKSIVNWGPKGVLEFVTLANVKHVVTNSTFLIFIISWKFIIIIILVYNGGNKILTYNLMQSTHTCHNF